MRSLIVRQNANAYVAKTKNSANDGWKNFHAYRWFLLVLLAVGAATVSADDSSLKITVQSQQHSVKNGNTFVVNTTIKNVSGKDQTIQVWSCSYDAQWKSDSPYAKPVTYACDKNIVKPIKLGPGERWSRNLDVRVTVPARKLVMR